MRNNEYISNGEKTLNSRQNKPVELHINTQISSNSLINLEKILICSPIKKSIKLVKKKNIHSNIDKEPTKLKYFNFNKKRIIPVDLKNSQK